MRPAKSASPSPEHTPCSPLASPCPIPSHPNQHQDSSPSGDFLQPSTAPRPPYVSIHRQPKKWQTALEAISVYTLGDSDISPITPHWCGYVRPSGGAYISPSFILPLLPLTGACHPTHTTSRVQGGREKVTTVSKEMGPPFHAQAPDRTVLSPGTARGGWSLQPAEAGAASGPHHAVSGEPVHGLVPTAPGVCGG